MSMVQMNRADQDLLEAVSTWFAGRLEEDPSIHDAMNEIENLGGENAEEIGTLLFRILGRTADMAAETIMKKLLG